VGQSILTYLPESERSRLNPIEWMQKWADTPQAPELAFVHLYVRTGTDPPEQIPVRVRVARLSSGDEVQYLVLFHDISRDHERLVQSRHAHLIAANLLSISEDALISVDEAGHIVYANANADRMFGYDAGGLVGLPLSDLLPEAAVTAHMRHMQAFSDDPHPTRPMRDRAEVSGRARDGREFPLHASITRVTVEGQTIFSALLRAHTD
jgi:PAS domain S-box-containing protein